ncbi:MAG: AGE family epimerase/isomerase [Lachnospiraceae bacterium]|nr:AGE family epimerase/isomerase [Lachnospiraceae bacterium]
MAEQWYGRGTGRFPDRKGTAGKRILDITLPLGWDKEHGGIIAFTDVSGKPPVQLEWDMKLWWPQCETIIAARLAYEVFKEEKYRNLYQETERYCEKYFVDEKNGEWYGYLHYDNTVSTTLKGNIFKGPFHIPRLYMIMSVFERGDSIEEYAK